MFRLKTTLKSNSRRLQQLLTVTTSANSQTPVRPFALFNSQKEGKSFDAAQGAQQQQRNQEDIIRSIEGYKANIRSKTQQGYSLSRGIAESFEANKHLKLQRYEIFIDKMQRLYKSELRFARKQQQKFQLQRNAILYSLTPLKDILKAYNELTQRGFNSEATVETLKNISNVFRARGYKGRAMGDYTPQEMDQSWRLQKLVDDLKFGLKPTQFFAPQHLSQVSLGLGDIGYKSTDLIPLMFEKLNVQLDERQLGTKTEQHSLNFNDAVYGGPKGFVDRHYVFKGFQNSEEFNEYLQILMDWEKDASEIETASLSAQKLNEQAAEIQKSMADIINAAVQVKELQKEYQSSIDNLRQQYFIMSEAADKHSFLQENQYIKYDLLELQELLVKGGYMEPEEAASAAISQEPFEQRMQRAADVFYDYVVNYAPELLSPQHQTFYETAVNADPKIAPPKSQENYLEENQNLINLKTLSQSLVGLSEQALSYRRDANGKDYLNKFYEDYLMPLEKQIHGNRVMGLEKLQYETVMMERAYLKAWQLFKEGSERILPRLTQLVREDKDSIEGQLNALTALTACRFDQPQLRAEIVSNALRALNQSQNISNSSIVSGLKGLAESASIDDKGRQLSQRLANRLETSALTFKEQLDALWSMSALQLYDAKAYQSILNHFNTINFERMDNDVKYEEYLKLLDIYNAIQFDAPKNLGLAITNKGLISGLQGKEMYLKIRFNEHLTKYDPFKQRVVQALSKGLTNASVEHQVILENDLYQAQALETEVLNSAKYPYRPDILMGYKGQKVGVFVLPETETMRDTLQADGAQRFRIRVLEQAHDGRIKLASLAVQDVVTYDLAAPKVELNGNFNLQQALDNQLKIKPAQTANPDFTSFTDFGSRFIANAADFLESNQTLTEKELQRVDSIVNRLYQILLLKQQTSLRFEPAQRQAGYDELRFQMMKLHLTYEGLSGETKAFVDSFARPNHSDFKSMLQATLQSIPHQERNNSHVDQGLDQSWIGTRQEVELPSTSSSIYRKSLIPELLNQRFLWVDDYFHYDDWRAKQKAVFDNFNLLVIPTSTTEQQKFFFDKSTHGRRVPQGVFPYPTHKRQLMLPATNNSVSEILRGGDKLAADEYVLFEKEPYKMMVVQELKKSETLASIDEDTSMITNLQNLKQGLKSDFSDKEILNTILLNMNFTDQLIEEHLNLKKSTGSNKSQVKYVPRDASSFRKFILATYDSKDREDPYTHFFLKEAKNKEMINSWIEEEKQRILETEEDSRDPKVMAEGEIRRQALHDKIDSLLLEEENRNEDLIQLSQAGLKTHVKVQYDIRTLIKSENVYDMEPELNDSSISDEAYLEQYRRRAEARLIKSKIIYKSQAKVDLTANEKAYLKQWIADIKDKKDRNLFNLRDSMVPNTSTKLTIGDVEAKSLYALNSVSRVNIERERLGKYSLNDLIVELSHFLDEDVVNKVETEIFSDRLRKEWGLSPDFKVIETRNKEISLVLNELEEVAWRSAGQFNERDIEYLKAMLSVKRNKDYFDRHFYENDMKSLSNFVETANQYDDRIKFLERWIVRKEDEIKARVVRPPKSLQKTDQELHAEIDAPMKRAREKIVSKLLIADEYGNQIDKEYKDLSSKELHTLTENLCLRLYLFNYEYPAFLPQVVRAVREHPNLLKSDADQIELYCKMFELDWRGDQNYDNRNQFMSSNPIYVEGSNLKAYGEVTAEVVKDKLQRACIPYVEETAQKLLSMSQ